MSSRPIIVVAGIGDSSAERERRLAYAAPVSRLFARSGYDVALIARESDTLHKFAAELTNGDVHAAAFPVSAYNYAEVAAAFDAARAHWPNGEIRVALFNVDASVWKPFLEITPEDIARATDANIGAAFAFAHGALRAFEGLPLDARGARGTLLFTGATASWRGNVTTSLFSASKFAQRALTQSLNKEFGKKNIHAIIDGDIVTDLSKRRHGEDWASNPDIALKPESIAAAYLYLVNQDRSAWTWELDLRPAHEKW
ncbi:NAD-P-binding protein [Gloeopeniophorella convolvens]|nr:NAD-P-binding protein [Gloeopeniophorella convolvens]